MSYLIYASLKYEIKFNFDQWKQALNQKIPTDKQPANVFSEIFTNFSGFFYKAYKNNKQYIKVNRLRSSTNRFYASFWSREYISQNGIDDILWIDDKQFIDKRLIDNTLSLYSRDLKINVIKEADADINNHTEYSEKEIKAKDIARAILRLIINSDKIGLEHIISDISEQDIVDEIHKVQARNKVYASKRNSCEKQALYNVLSSKDPVSLYYNIKVSKSNSHRMYQRQLTKDLAKQYKKVNNFGEFIKANKDHKYMLETINDHATKVHSYIYKQIWSSNNKNRVSTLVAKNFNRKNYKLACTVEYFCNAYHVCSYERFKLTIWNFIKTLIKIRITNKALASILKGLYTDATKVNNLEHWIHDKSESIRTLQLVFDKLSEIDPQHHISQKITKIIIDDLIAYEAGTGAISYRHKRLYNLLYTAQRKGNNEELIAILRDSKSFTDIELKIREHIDKATIVVLKDDLSKCVTQDLESSINLTILYGLHFLYKNVVSTLNNLKKCSIIDVCKSITISNDLKVSLYPANYYDGWLGVNASGVCIDYAFHSHLSLIKPEAINLVVHANDSIQLWMFTTKCKAKINNQEVDVLVINSFQGSLKTRYKQYQKEILSSVVNILNENISMPILFCHHSFNTFNLNEFTNAEPIVVDITQTPQMRLDFGVGMQDFLLLNKASLAKAA